MLNRATTLSFVRFMASVGGPAVAMTMQFNQALAPIDTEQVSRTLDRWRLVTRVPCQSHALLLRVYDEPSHACSLVKIGSLIEVPRNNKDDE